ncbi:hypothetical protein SAMN05216223_10462 [Actinacidiphila yanglinensis]|uniref:Uncharacterized protein n=1 Tax=Actinacidiphila yanglinensis TaxID=310779 RepID=A0A1H5YMJ3_9ACTN|nr:hypothetical protein [Actinacidiphila yanglinensis]SEG25379.1 hypothetical protein SAMN05216223_10462 [Actinacidiphila yanglinensis]
MDGCVRWRRGGGAAAAAGVMAAAVVLAGCGAGSGSGGNGSGHGDGPAGPGHGAAGSTAAAPRRSSVPPAVPSSVPPRTTSAGADAGLRSCYDGSCEITVTGPVTIPVADRFGFPAVEVTHVGADGVTIEANGGGTHLESGVGPGGTAALNGISVRVRAVHGNTAELSVSHG